MTDLVRSLLARRAYVQPTHVVVDLIAQPPVFRCEHCGVTETLTTPVPLRGLEARGRRLGDQHRSCRAITKPAGPF
jgi:hypothetical protein